MEPVQVNPVTDPADVEAVVGGSGTFLEFAQVAEQVGATTRRLEKAALLGGYFAVLNDGDLIHAARYFAGYTFPLRDQRVTNVGGSTLLKALSTVARIEPTTLKERLVALGDLGEVAAAVFPTGQSASLMLEDVAIAIEQLAATQGAKRKLEWVIALLKRATPLESKYLVKLLLGDLRIGLKEGAVEDAIARLSQQDVSRIQWVNMLTGDIGETALLARHSQLETAQMRLFHPIKFMLASPAATLEEVGRQMSAEFAVEDKYDGIRAQVHIAPAKQADSSMLHGVVHQEVRVALFSRTLDEITFSFPDLVVPLAALQQQLSRGSEADLILDGEIVPVQNKALEGEVASEHLSDDLFGDRLLPFQELQKRLGRKTLPESLLASIPVAFVAYDVLYADGEVLIDKPYAIRRTLLESLPLNTSTLRRAVSQRFNDAMALEKEFAAARERGNEGLMVKDPASAYKPGRRGRDWLKIKRALASLDVVVTAAEVGSGRRHHVLSDYTFAVRTSEADPTLLNVGKAYSGLTDAEILELSDWFRAHTLQEFAHGKVCTVEPQIVLEVTFDRVQASERHKSGYALRFPRIVRIRQDKSPAEIDTLETVRRLAEIPI